MKKIKIKSMHMVNFKGVRDLEIDFKDITVVKGRNGLGKTTIFDAFTWLMFGKNSEDAKAFSIKTLDDNGKVIPKIPHEVSAVISVDEEEITLTRRYNEKWTKKKGSVEEEFTGHEEERLFNDVPCSVKDWNAKIESVCDESTFKMITNPTFFTSQKKDAQRSMLFQMAGGVDDAEIADGNDDFKALLEMSTGKTLEEFKKEIGAKKKRVKAEIDGIPERIDERKRNIPADQPLDEKTTKECLVNAEAKLKEIDAQMSDASAMLKASEEKIKEYQKDMFNLNCSIDKRKRDLEQKAMASFNEQNNRNQRLANEIAILENNVSNAEERRSFIGKYIKELQAKGDKLRQEWYAKDAETLNFSEGDFVCPTCGRPLEVADIEAKRAEMTAKFNARKADELSKIASEGKQNKAVIDAKMNEVEKLENDITEAKININQKKMEISELPRPNVDAIIENDEQLKGLQKALAELKDKGVDGVASVDNSTLQAERTMLVSEIASRKAQLEMIKLQKDNEKRIAELEELMKSQANELARLEGIEFNIQQFSKAKITAVEDKINSLFSHVKFKLYETQINGGEVETCEAMVDGVPFSDLNNAGRINAGLDIINAIIKTQQICAPIFVDNSESINEVQMGPSQYILLKVTEDKQLTIE